MKEHFDYHMVLLRGFVLAHNPPQQILQALDAIMMDYKSKAAEGGEIDAASSQASYFWTDEAERILKLRYEAGATVESIASELGRTVHSVRSRVGFLDLKRRPR